MNPLVPLSILFLLPLAAIFSILHFDDGIDPSLGKAAIMWAAILIAVGAGLSFAASKLSGESND